MVEAITPLQAETLKILRRGEILTAGEIASRLLSTDAGRAQWPRDGVHKKLVTGRTVRGLLVSLQRRGLIEKCLDTRGRNAGLPAWYITNDGIDALVVPE